MSDCKTCNHYHEEIDFKECKKNETMKRWNDLEDCPNYEVKR